jgi:hypothetical protein
MNDVIVIFGVLLSVLMLISTFGGSIRFQEYYEDPPVTPSDYTPPITPPALPTNVVVSDQVPQTPPVGAGIEAFDGEAYAGFDGDDEA